MPKGPDQNVQAFLLRQPPNGREPHRLIRAFPAGVGDGFQHATANAGGDHVSGNLVGGGGLDQVFHEGAGNGPSINLACNISKGRPIHSGGQPTWFLGSGHQSGAAGGPSCCPGQQRVDEELVEPGTKDRCLDGLVSACDVGMEGVEMRDALEPRDPGSQDQSPSFGLRVHHVKTCALRNQPGAAFRVVQDAQVCGKPLDIDGRALDNSTVPRFLQVSVRGYEAHPVPQVREFLDLSLDRTTDPAGRGKKIVYQQRYVHHFGPNAKSGTYISAAVREPCWPRSPNSFGRFRV